MEAVRLLQAWRGLEAAIRAQARATSYGKRGTPGHASKLAGHVRGPVDLPQRSCRSFHQGDHRAVRPADRLDCSTVRSCVASRRQSRVAFQRIAQFVTRAQQNDTYKSAPHAQLISNFVI